jgi:hypothetical protein
MLSFGATANSLRPLTAGGMRSTAKTMAAWIKRCNTSTVPTKLSLTLVPITVTQPVAAGELLLRHASGRQLALPAGVDVAWLAGLLWGLV